MSLDSIQRRLATAQDELVNLEGLKTQAQGTVTLVKNTLLVKEKDLAAAKLDGSKEEIEIAGDTMLYFQELLNYKSKALVEAEEDVRQAEEKINALKKQESEALQKVEEEKPRGRKVTVDASDGIPTLQLPPEGPPQPFFICKLLAKVLGAGRSSWDECNLPDFCHEKKVLRLGDESDLKRMTTAWWEDDEIECVWLGEGRIEHKPVLRKITIFSRAGDSHKLTFELLKEALPEYAIQWRDG